MLMKNLLFSLLLLLQYPLFAEMDVNSSNTQLSALERMKMVREARLLTKEQQLLNNKLQSWRKHRERLVERFERKNQAIEEMALGRDNQYGLRLAQKRRSEFYASLDKKEERIQKRLFEIEKKLSKLKNDFLFRYAVELTDDEIFHGKTARVKERTKKVEMLKEYMQYMKSYEELSALNAKYDQAEMLLQSIAKINDKEKTFEQNLTKKAQENRIKMYEYKTMADRLREEFYNQYHVQIDDMETAEKFLENIQKAY